MITEEVISKIKKNIFHRAQKIIVKYENFDWDKYDNGEIRTSQNNSSQAIAIDIWGCIALSPCKDNIINSIFNENEKDWKIKFEYRNKKNILNEILVIDKNIDARTCIDVVLFCENKAIFIESKFSEKNIDFCKHCNGKYEDNLSKKLNTYKCELTSKGIKYWDYIPKIYDLQYDSDGNIKPCPFRSQYQIMRNLCLGKAVEIDKKIKIRNCIVYIKSPKCKMYNKFNDTNFESKLTEHLIDKTRLSIMHYNDKDGIIEKAKNVVWNNKDELIVFEDLKEWINGKIENLLDC